MAPVGIEPGWLCWEREVLTKTPLMLHVIHGGNQEAHPAGFWKTHILTAGMLGHLITNHLCTQSVFFRQRFGNFCVFS